MENCDFCSSKIDSKQLVFKGKRMKIIYPIRPVIDAHFLIMPIKHRELFENLNKEESAELIFLIKLIATKLGSSKQLAGYNIISNSGKKAGQEISHTHIHIFCRFHDEAYSPFDVLNNPKKYKIETLEAPMLKKKVEKYIKIFG